MLACFNDALFEGQETLRSPSADPENGSPSSHPPLHTEPAHALGTLVCFWNQPPHMASN